ncbi:MAG: PEP-CTERM sorting domain-containing protein [Verrucomicrobiota bacterium]
MQKVRLVLAIAGVLTLPSPLRAQFADSVVSFSSGAGAIAGYNVAGSALGAPSTQTVDPDPLYGGTFPVDPFNAAYLPSQVVSLGAGGSLTVHFASPIFNSGANPFGLDFIVFGNSGFIDNDWPNGLSDGSLYGANNGVTRVSVSANGLDFFTLNPALAPTVDSLFPTDGAGDFQLPVNPALTPADFDGKNLAGIRALYHGSGGGTGYDIGWAQGASLGSISYVRIEVLSGHSEIDALSVVPEPTTLSLASFIAGLVLVRRRQKR